MKKLFFLLFNSPTELSIYIVFFLYTSIDRARSLLETRTGFLLRPLVYLIKLIYKVSGSSKLETKLRY